MSNSLEISTEDNKMEHPSRPTLVGHCLLFPNGVTIVVVVVVIASVSHYLYVIVESAISVIRQESAKGKYD